ncbi:MAG: amidohydrolase family protein [Planctomycetota bacterium]
MIRLSNLAQEIFEEIRRIPVVDTHEHLYTEAERLVAPTDATTLLSHYCRCQFEADGMGEEEAEALFDATAPLLPRWRKLQPYWDAFRFTGYAYPAQAYVRDVLAFDTIDETTVEAISARLQADAKPGFYTRILKNLCGIETAIQCRPSVEKGDPDFFVYLCRDQAMDLASPGGLGRFEKLTGKVVGTLEECVRTLREFIAGEKAKGAVGLKLWTAYYRTLETTDVPAAVAARAFSTLRKAPDKVLETKKRRALEDYLLLREIEAAVEANLPVAIHTGLQAHGRNDIRNARATHLYTILKAYPRARFDLFHGSFPYVEDAWALGQYFENVALNMCWMHTMSPAIARRALAEWLEAVPVTRIFAFGADSRIAEKVYGHLKLARMNLAAVLAEKVEAGAMNRGEALSVARLLLRENPRAWYSLP